MLSINKSIVMQPINIENDITATDAYQHLLLITSRFIWTAGHHSLIVIKIWTTGQTGLWISWVDGSL